MEQGGIKAGVKTDHRGVSKNCNVPVLTQPVVSIAHRQQHVIEESWGGVRDPAVNSSSMLA